MQMPENEIQFKMRHLVKDAVNVKFVTRITLRQFRSNANPKAIGMYALVEYSTLRQSRELLGYLGYIIK